ncbi:hypothetical protein JJQ97_05065 [Pseudomonas syringae]|uniref:hypothetical protein n=1 Tax=Pseudomonas syringae TaxID=317 RepID=UPI001917940B|nr:hypothetical protein [Pseudomonas syringae]QQQ51610.1 hypothetical protein JJQ97_05065 [Pseudomonas syringae]
MRSNDRDRDNQHERRAKEVLKRSGRWICAYPGCTSKSIFSHAISKSISLGAIAEDGHLQTIKSQRKGDVKDITFGLIGIHDATAFNGFCSQHDALFAALDTRKIEGARDLMLQAYRTVIAESIDESRLATLNAEEYEGTDLDELLGKLDAADHTWIEDEQGQELFKAEFGKLAVSATRRAVNLLQLPSEILTRIDVLGNQRLDGNSVISTEQLSHHIPYRRLEVRLPVAVNAMIHGVQGDQRRDFFFAVIPYADSTFVFGVVPKACPQWLLDGLMESFSSDPGLIDLVESVMISSNEWYLTPSVLAQMPSEKKEVFLHDCTFFNEHRFYEQYDMILLEDARRDLAKNQPELIAALRLDLVDYVPFREDFAVRHERMIAAMCAQPFEFREI